MKIKSVNAKELCPECVLECSCNGKKLKEPVAYNTKWYGRLTYYFCTCCKTRFVSQNGDALEIAAPTKE